MHELLQKTIWLDVMDQWVEFLLHVCKVQGENLHPETSYPD